MTDKPLVISSPLPRTLPLILAPDRLAELHARYEVIETTDAGLPGLSDPVLSRARYIIGQPPLDPATLARLATLRAIFNVESNLLNNMPYPQVFARGIHVLTTGAVFAQPVAEMGLGMALSLLRGIHTADADFRAGRERWGGEGNAGMRQLAGATVGIVGFGDLGRALARVLSGFRPRLLAHDPWQAASLTRAAGAEPVALSDLLARSDVVFVTAAVTSENAGFLGADAFAAMRPGAAFVLLSRAEVVDFDAMVEAVARGHIRAATDVFVHEPVPLDHPIRSLNGILLSAHRAGALESAFSQMGEMVLEDMELMDRGLPPQVCKRAERETVARMRSKPVRMN